MDLKKIDKYTKINEVDDAFIKMIIDLRRSDKFYPSYHIAPKHGLLNDPNGLCFYNGEHHVFYQWHPLGANHGIKYWYHVSTKDFVTYNDLGIALSPVDKYDSHGCYSGSGVVDNDKVYLFYTGNRRDENMVRQPTQCVAMMNECGNVKKEGVVIKNEFFTEHFRDPKVWKVEDVYYMVVGVQTLQLKGQMALYQSDNISNWNFVGIIDTEYKDYGFMWECPDYFEIENNGVMLFSPQGVENESKYELLNNYNVSYIIGDKLDLKNAKLDNHGNITELDSGFDFYAPQTYKDIKGRRILIGWVGLPEIEYPTDCNEWAGMLSVPRELSIKEGKLIQTPIDEIKKLEKGAKYFENIRNISLETTAFVFSLNLNIDDLIITFKNDVNESVDFIIGKSEFELSRKKMTKKCALEFGTSRYVKRTKYHQNVRIYVDNSVMEIFINDGENTMTSRVFVESMSTITFNEKVSCTLSYMCNIEKHKQ